MLNIYKYNDSFPILFKKEKEKLSRILGDICLIEHIGSTAIEGVDGKGVIDIMLIFRKSDDLESAIKLLQTNGYFLATDSKDRKGRIFMSSSGTKESNLGDIHLHLTTKDNDTYLNAILFRNYLRKHPKEKQEYIDLKYQLFKNVEGDRKKYTESKSGFIEKIIYLAKKESN